MRPNSRIDEVQPHAPLAYSTRLLAIVTVRDPLITLQMSLSASEATCPHSLWFTRCSSLRCTWVLRCWHLRDWNSSSQCDLVGAGYFELLERRADIAVEVWRGQLLRRDRTKTRGRWRQKRRRCRRRDLVLIAQAEDSRKVILAIEGRHNEGLRLVAVGALLDGEYCAQTFASPRQKKPSHIDCARRGEEDRDR